jgi:chromate transporter
MLATPRREETGAVPFGVAVRVWARIGLLSFGGPAGQIALMHRELVERLRWISEGRFIHALNYCMLLPGPEAQQLAIYIGWLLHRTVGGVVAGTLFVLPGVLTMLALSLLYASFRQAAPIEALFYGLKAAVLAIVIEAVIRIGRRALLNAVHALIAAGAFVALFFLDVPFPAVVFSAGLIGCLGSRFLPGAFSERVNDVHEPSARDANLLDAMIERGDLTHVAPSAVRAVRVLLVCLALWFLPIIAAALAWGPGSVFVQQGLFFSKAAVVTFGGAYAVLAYIAQRAVEGYGWIEPGEMLDGLGMAETTPGPLIMVVQFVAFMGAYRNPGLLNPIVAGVLGSLLTVWVTFVPCFLWIFLGAPYIESLRGNRRLRATLSGITASVVGVILNLSVWFFLNTLFAEVGEAHIGPVRLYRPAWHTLDIPSLVLAIVALVSMLRYRLSLLWTLGASTLLGFIWRLVGLS